MIVELISVGTELLLGNIVNTNAAYLAEQCAGMGLSCYFQSVVGDNEERLSMTLKCDGSFGYRNFVRGTWPHGG